MAVRIRLRRIGKCPKKRPHFRITVFDGRRSRDSTYIEELGFYEPTKNPPIVKLNKERYDFWVKNGAQASQTIKSLIKKLQEAKYATVNS